MSHRSDLAWLNTPGWSAPPGWEEVVTPLGASAHARINSSAWDLCTEWALLHSGRGALCPTDPMEWFGEDGLATAHPGVVAELLAAGGRLTDFTNFVSEHSDAREHILQLQDHVFGAEPEEWLVVSRCLDIVRLLEARDAASAAAAEVR